MCTTGKILHIYLTSDASKRDYGFRFTVVHIINNLRTFAALFIYPIVFVGFFLFEFVCLLEKVNEETNRTDRMHICFFFQLFFLSMSFGFK